ncbi:MAG TPA: L-fucose/L-arabinose isomerase family protein [Acidimicrobiales bacterium]|nr:L-fucose/L-arabinose isomerase family protein [Acidimicrobiales bacterium]
MSKVGVLSFSDGRDFVHEGVASFVAAVEDRIVAACKGFGAEVVRGKEVVRSNETGVREGRRMAAERPDITIFNYPVWAWPHFSVHAAKATIGPLLLFSNIDPTYPGMVSLLAAGGSLDQIGRLHERLWGEVEDPAVSNRLRQLVTAAHAARSLEGRTFARLGGRSMGMYTAVGRTDEWMAKFGIDVEEVDQWEIVRRSEHVPVSQARGGREWLEKYAAGVHYDGKKLTPEILERQVRSYYAVKEILDEGHIDFCGIKGQPELTGYFATADIAEAFLNDPYDFDGPKAPVICATECDMDGALTMQIMHKVTGTPVLFADVRHYFTEEGIWDLENSGQHATWFAARSDDPAENMAKVHLYPEEWYFPAGGAAVHHLAAPGEITLARLSRLNARYRLQVTKGRFETYDDEKNEALMHQSNYVWPHAFTRMDAPADVFLSRFGANHIHAVPGDITGELAAVCQFLDIDLERLDA